MATPDCAHPKPGRRSPVRRGRRGRRLRVPTPALGALGATILAAACSSAGPTLGAVAPTAEPTAAPETPATPTPEPEPAASATPTPSPTATPQPDPIPGLSARSLDGSALVELVLDEASPWDRVAVTLDGTVRAVTETGRHRAERPVATVWVPPGRHEVCVGPAAAGMAPRWWDGGNPPPPDPPTAPTPTASPDPADPGDAIGERDAPPNPEPDPGVDVDSPPETPARPHQPQPPVDPPDITTCTTVTGRFDAQPALFPGHRVVAYYGNGTTSALGVLGEGTPRQATARLLEATAAFDPHGLPTVPAFEYIATVAQATAGADGSYSFAWPADDVRPYLQQMRRVGGIVVLDLQPGRSAFLDQAELYEELLREPDVHLALDPEWSMGPNGVPGRVIGSTDAETVNEVLAWIQELVISHGLPQKLVIVHQFQHRMIEDRDRIHDPEGVAVMFHVDGQGPVPTKYDTYGELFVDHPYFNGFKVFFDEDSRVMPPEEVAALEPPPVYVSYQ